MMNYKKPVLLDFVRGDGTGLSIPAHARALRTAGEAFLTEAFRQYGSISPDNSVARITRFELFAGGNSGQKLILSVDYARDEPGLHTDLFVKFSRSFDDGFHDRRRHELEDEVRLAALSRLPAFPVRVPVPYFADNHRETGTGLLITQNIEFGNGGIESLHPKCMDHELDNPLEHYRAIVSALARLAAADKSGQLSPEINAYFPFDADAAAAFDPIPWDEQQLIGQVAHFADFIERCPRLLPAHITSASFLAQFQRQAVRFLQNEAAVKHFLHADRDYVALCHWNTNIDNAWFWRDASGVLQCGLLDWGRSRQMNVTYGLWGGLSGANPDLWNRHIDELLGLFSDELSAYGGARLDVDELKLHLHLSVAMLGLALMMGVPEIVLSRLPDAVDARGPLDPILYKDRTARSFLHIFTNFLNLWATHDFEASLNEALRRMGERD